QRAGVLICLFLDQEMDLLKVILTKRTSSLSSHSGEVALPGGKWDEGDEDEVSTALREAREEIGLDPSLVKVVTQLEPFISKLLVRVVPVIALLPHRQKFVPRINPDEVASMFEAPLEMFLKDENHRMGERTFLGISHPVHYFDFDYNGEHHLIWGATATILIRAASLVYDRGPDF
ncbi:hypothetical protein SELMODRAFT_67467, partial [Selaginella moellendorffii]